MNRKKVKDRVSTFGRRTGLDVKAGKRIRVNHDGIECFDDYWTSSDDNTVGSISSPLCSSPANFDAPRMSSFMKNMSQSPRKELPGKISFVLTPELRSHSQEKHMRESVAPKQTAVKRKLLAKGRRTGIDIIAGKEIQIINGVENFDNYWTDSSALTSIHGGKISSYKVSSSKYASLDEIPNANHESGTQELNSELLANAETTSIQPQKPIYLSPVSENLRPRVLRYSSKDKSIKIPSCDGEGITAMQPFSNETSKKMLRVVSPVLSTPENCNSHENQKTVPSENSSAPLPDKQLVDHLKSHENFTAVEHSSAFSSHRRVEGHCDSLENVTAAVLSLSEEQPKGHCDTTENLPSPSAMDNLGSSESNRLLSKSFPNSDRQTKTDIFAGKETPKVIGVENYDNYLTDSSALTSIHGSKISSIRASSSKYASLDIISNANQESGMQELDSEPLPKGERFMQPRSPVNSSAVPEPPTPRALRYCSRDEGNKSEAPLSEKSAVNGGPTSPPKVNDSRSRSLHTSDTYNTKEIQKDNAVENCDSYLTDSSALTSIHSGKISSIIASSSKSASLDKISNANQDSGIQELDSDPLPKGETFIQPRSPVNSSAVPEPPTPRTLRYCSREEGDKSEAPLSKKSAVNGGPTSPPRVNDSRSRRLLTSDTYNTKEIQKDNEVENCDRLGQTSPPRASNSPSTNLPMAVTHKSVLKRNDPAEIALKDGASKSKKRKKLPPTVTSLTNQKNTEDVNEGETQLRRSQRTRFRPLEGWRNQHLHINWENGEIASVEVEEGSKPDTSSVDRILRRQEQNKAKKKKKVLKKGKLLENTLNLKQIQQDIDKTEVFNPQTGEEELVYLHRPHDTLLWTVPPLQDENDASYTITKCFSGELISFGFIEIGVGKKKKEQHSPEHNIAFNVVKGNNIRIRIHKTKLTLKELDYVVVPAGNVYSMHNRGKTIALLNFSTFKAPMFDYQIPNSKKGRD